MRYKFMGRAKPGSPIGGIRTQDYKSPWEVGTRYIYYVPPFEYRMYYAYIDMDGEKREWVRLGYFSDFSGSLLLVILWLTTGLFLFNLWHLLVLLIANQ